MTSKNAWDKELGDDEKIEYEFSISEKYRKVNLIGWCILSVPLLFALGLGIFTFVFALLYYRYYLPLANSYAFTDKRILIRRGWLSVHTISVDYDRITDMQVIEPFFDKLLFGSGNLAVNTAGSSGNEVMLMHINDPYEVKKQLNKIRERQSAK